MRSARKKPYVSGATLPTRFPPYRFLGITALVRTYPLADRICLLLFSWLACMALLVYATRADATDCPTSAHEISTDRPDFTSPPFAVPAGSVQLENGVTRSAEDRSNVIQGPQTLLRVGIARCAEIFFSVPDYVYAIGGNAPAGFSDFAASAKLQLPKVHRLRRSGGCRNVLSYRWQPYFHSRIRSSAPTSLEAHGRRLLGYRWDVRVDVDYERPAGEPEL